MAKKSRVKKPKIEDISAEELRKRNKELWEEIKEDEKYDPDWPFVKKSSGGLIRGAPKLAKKGWK